MIKLLSRYVTLLPTVADGTRRLIKWDYIPTKDKLKFHVARVDLIDRTMGRNALAPPAAFTLGRRQPVVSEEIYIYDKICKLKIGYSVKNNSEGNIFLPIVKLIPQYRRRYIKNKLKMV
ncbi:hypothetical protein GWI33_018047 [Rhynchophorus ferrugineus]|uniref:Uncharacterized protein n=1 Tax=Rhynchophorus ferrugineus TaxID=354439 RepID=A0A834HX22_RHYFE|nr:hypothetical protein GWI33_018047 [Rhynchophorus ferrugineus]